MIIKIPYVMALLIAAPIWIYKRRAHYRAHRHDFHVRHEVILSLLFVYGLAVAGLMLFPFVPLGILLRCSRGGGTTFGRRSCAGCCAP